MRVRTFLEEHNLDRYVLKCIKRFIIKFFQYRCTSASREAERGQLMKIQSSSFKQSQTGI